ncbi:MAG: hypothetical protein U9Q67_00300 [Patescibacteria group bacterium]|nr:hypothetical protein [Patescibacteria group bacterium]
MGRKIYNILVLITIIVIVVLCVALDRKFSDAGVRYWREVLLPILRKIRAALPLCGDLLVLGLVGLIVLIMVEESAKLPWVTFWLIVVLVIADLCWMGQPLITLLWLFVPVVLGFVADEFLGSFPMATLLGTLIGAVVMVYVWTLTP